MTSQPARLADAFAVCVLVVVTMVALLTFRSYGLGWDDLTHSQYGDLLLAFYSSGFRDTRAFSFVNLYYYGGGFDMVAALLDKALPFNLFETRRLAGAFVGIVGLMATWRLGRRVGGPVAGLLALVLLATCPLYYGHMFINPKDIPFAALMAVALLGTVRMVEEYPRPRAATWLLFGLGLGLAVGSRIMGGFAVLYAVAALAILVVAEAREHGRRQAAASFKTFVRPLVVSVIVAYSAMALVWPWSVFNPINPIKAAAYFGHFFEKPWRELFAGELILAPDMPRSYVPTLLWLQLPELFLALAAAGLAGALALVVRRDVDARRRAIVLIVALAACLPIVVAVATRPAMYNGIRHLLFVIPPMAVLCGLGGNSLFELFRRTSHPVRLGASAVLVAGLALPAIEMVRLHPYQYVYFNQLAGGVRGAEGQYMLDYWGISFKQASQELVAKIDALGLRPERGRKWKIAVCGPHPPAAIALGDQFELTWDPKGADFTMMLGVFYCAKLDAPVLLEISREGVLFARAYDIRGRQIRSLFTLPPVQGD